jgi:bacterioferritin
MCENWGYARLHQVIRKSAIDEMKHAEELIERILHLDGVPNMQRLDKVKVGERVAEQLKLDREMEASAVQRLNKTIALAVELGDNVTRELLEDVLKSEDDHLHWLESQLELIKQVGEQNYLAQQIREEE